MILEKIFIQKLSEIKLASYGDLGVDLESYLQHFVHLKFNHLFMGICVKSAYNSKTKEYRNIFYKKVMAI